MPSILLLRDWIKYKRFEEIVSVQTPRSYAAEVKEVHSGDDLMVLVDLGVDNLHKKVRVRLQGVDTPDAYRAEGSTEAGTVREDVKRLVTDRLCTIEVHSERRASWIVTLYVQDGPNDVATSLNQYLIDKGYIFKGIVKNHGKSA